MGVQSRLCLEYEVADLLYFTHYPARKIQPISEFELETPTMVTRTLTAVPRATYKIGKKTVYNQAGAKD